MSIFFKDKKEEITVVKKPISPPVSQQPIMRVVGTDNQFADHFTKLLKTCNIQGPDYYEFSLALEGLKDQPLTEQQKYVSVFSSFATMGVTKDKLLETADVYIKRIEKEKLDFASQLDSDTTAEIKGREEKIKNLNEENQQLTLKLQENNSKISRLNAEIADTSTQLSNSSAGFNQALQVILDQINNRIINIKNYLQ